MSDLREDVEEAVNMSTPPMSKRERLLRLQIGRCLTRGAMAHFAGLYVEEKLVEKLSKAFITFAPIIRGPRAG